MLAVFCPFQGGGCVVVNALFSVTPIVCGGFVFGPCFVVQYFLVFPSFAIISLGKRELVALFLVSS